MSKTKVLSVQRTAYHKVVMHYIERDTGTVITKVTPDVGPMPDVSGILKKPFTDVSKARTALREAMKAKNDRDVSHIAIKPQKWIQFVLALDEFLLSVGKDFDDLGVGELQYPELRVVQQYRDISKPCLIGVTALGDQSFEFNFGEIDWVNYKVI